MKVTVTFVKEQEIKLDEQAMELFKKYGEMFKAYDEDCNNPDPTEDKLYKQIEKYCEDRIFKPLECGYIKDVAVDETENNFDYEIYFD